MPPPSPHHAIETVFRIEQARLIASLTRFVGDIGFAEELAQDALLAALSEWPVSGVPDKPGAWLMVIAKRRAVDLFRHGRMAARKHTEIGRDDDRDAVASLDDSLDDDVGDELLSLMFTACHPMLSPEAAAALTLRLIGGLTTEEIARAFLSSEPTIAQRIVRAKKTLRDAGVAYEVPRGAERERRLAAVLAVVYLIFNEGYAATSGDALVRPDLCAEAQRLGRILAGLAPDEPEVFGLLALMEIQTSRLHARSAPDGSFVPLTEQDRSRWDRLLIRRGLDALVRAEALGGADGPYALQAALAACHARARTAAETDWKKIAALYDRLLSVMPSPVVGLNRAVAHSMAYGPQAGLALLGEIEHAEALKSYAPLPAAKGDFLFRAGRRAEAKAEFERAAALTRNQRKRRFCSGGRRSVGTSFIRRPLVVERPLRQHDRDAAAGHIDVRHHRGGERQHHGAAPAVESHLDDVAGTEIVHGDDRPEGAAVAIHGRETDQVGVIELVRLGGRQALAGDEQFDVAQAFGGIAIVDAFEAGDEAVLGGTQCRDLDRAAVGGRERPVAADRVGFVGEREQPHLAAHAVRRADARDADAFAVVVRHRAPSRVLMVRDAVLRTAPHHEVRHRSSS
jgi:RNA polymerase sigma factor (sigma-70 family)